MENIFLAVTCSGAASRQCQQVLMNMQDDQGEIIGREIICLEERETPGITNKL